MIEYILCILILHGRSQRAFLSNENSVNRLSTTRNKYNPTHSCHCTIVSGSRITKINIWHWLYIWVAPYFMISEFQSANGWWVCCYCTICLCIRSNNRHYSALIADPFKWFKIWIDHFPTYVIPKTKSNIKHSMGWNSNICISFFLMYS